MEPILIGAPFFPDSVSDDDIKYVLDLGLLKQQSNTYMPANPIYLDVIIRTLTQRLQASLPESLIHRWMDGKTLDMNSLLKEFQTYWRNNSGFLPDPYDYAEASAHIILFAFLQRVLNGGAKFVSREHALGSYRVDICISYKGNFYPIELKLKDHQKLDESLEQIWKYVEISGAAEGWLVIFDRTSGKRWEEKLSWKNQNYKDKIIHVVGC
jgi:hypothetical protein